MCAQGGPDRTQTDERITQLHTVAADLQSVATEEAVYDVIIDAAVDILGFDWCVIAVPDGDWFELRRVSAATPLEAGERPLRLDEGIVGKTYQTGESHVVADEAATEVAVTAADSITSGLSVPLGEWGVLQGSSSDRDAFDESDREAAELLAAHARAALDRIARERDLEQYETVAEAVEDLVYVVDADGQFQFVNEAQESLTGYSREELLGEHISVLMSEQSRAKAREHIETLREGDRRSVTFERTLITADGGEIFCEDHMALLPTGDGEFRGTAGIVRDITGRKQRQRELEEKNERLEQFASIVSHDLRNPLDVVKGRLEYLDEEYDDDHIQVARDSTERMEALITELLTLARGNETLSASTPVDLASLATESWDHVETGGATLVVQTDLVICADASRTQELLGNLFRNSVEHGEDTTGGDLTVTVGTLADESGFFVADDGQGIPPDHRTDVFSAGFTTSSMGTGFGLTIVDQIADAHGWTVSVTESEDGGARFEFTGVDGESA